MVIRNYKNEMNEDKLVLKTNQGNRDLKNKFYLDDTDKKETGRGKGRKQRGNEISRVGAVTLQAKPLFAMLTSHISSMWEGGNAERMVNKYKCSWIGETTSSKKNFLFTYYLPTY